MNTETVKLQLKIKVNALFHFKIYQCCPPTFLDVFRDFQSLEIKSYLDQILMCLRFIILGIIIKMKNIYKYIVKTKIKIL